MASGTRGGARGRPLVVTDRFINQVWAIAHGSPMVFGSSGSRGKQGSFAERLAFWFRAVRGDHQYLLLGVLLALVIVGGVLIDSARTLQGVSTTGVLDANEQVMDIAWDADGDVALAIVERSDGTFRLTRWDGATASALATADTPRSVDWHGAGWMIGGANGALSTCAAGCASAAAITDVGATWADNASSRNTVIGIAGVDADSAILLVEARVQLDNGTRSVTSVEVRTLSNGAVSNATSLPTDSHRLRSIALVGDGRALGIGVDDAVTPTLGVAGTVVVEIEGRAGGLPPTINPVMSSASGRPHTIIPADSGDHIALVAGVSQAMWINDDLSIEVVDGHRGSSAAAADADGTIWFAPPGGGDVVEVLESGGRSVVRKALPEGQGVWAQKAAMMGDDVAFYGSVDAGQAVREVSIDPDASKAPTSLGIMGELFFVILFIVMAVTMGYTIYSNWGSGGW